MLETKVVTAHVPRDLADEVDKVAERLQRSRGWVVKQALRAWLVQQESNMAPTGFAEAQKPFSDVTTKQETATALDAVAALKTLRKTTTLGDISWRDLRDSGRK